MSSSVTPRGSGLPGIPGNRNGNRTVPAKDRRVMRASLWVFIGLGMSQGLRLIGNLILTRLLFPEAFGLMALVNITIQGMFMISDVGIQGSIVRSDRGEDSDFVNTAWTIQIIRGVGLFLCVLLLAYPFSVFYGDPRFVTVLPVVGCTAVFAGLNSTALIVANRKLWVGRATALELATQVVGLIVMVVWAWYAPSIWALAGGQIVSSALKAVLSHYIFPSWRTKLAWDRKAAHEIVHFGKWILVASLLGFLAGQLDRLVLGRLATLDMVGIYSIGFMLAQLPLQVVIKWIASVYFPFASEVYRGVDKSGKSIIGMRRRLNLVCGLGIAVLFAAAEPLFRFFYTPEYWGAIVVMQVILLGSGIQILNASYSRLNLVYNMPMLTAVSSLAAVVLFAVTVYPLYQIWGVNGVALAFSVSHVGAYVVSGYGASKVGKLDWVGDAGIVCACAGIAWILSEFFSKTVGG